MEKYRKFALELGELYEGRRAAYYFEWSPKFIKMCRTDVLKENLMEEAENVIDMFLKELKNPPKVTPTRPII